MESQSLIMKLAKLTFPIKGISEHQLIFFDFGDSNVIPFSKGEKRENCNTCVEHSDVQSVLDFGDYNDSVQIHIPYSSRNYFVNKNGVIGYINPFVVIVILAMLLNGIILLVIGFLTILRVKLKYKDTNVNLVVKRFKQNLKDNLKRVVIFQKN